MNQPRPAMWKNFERGVAAARWAAPVALLLVLLGATDGLAQSDAERTRAQKLLAEGAALLDRGRPAESLESFQEAYSVVRRPHYHYNIATAQQAIGQDLEALESFERFLSEAPDVRAEH